jgi:hypothetical protein
MAPLKRCSAIKAGALLALLFAARAIAVPIGVVTDSTGPLLAKTAGGSIKVLAVGSAVELADTLVSRTGAYARVVLTDHTTVALGPDTELVFEKYSFHEIAAPTSDDGSHPDAAILILSKGRLRVTSGTLGARDTDSFTLKAGTAVIDIRHSTFIAEYLAPPGQLAQGDAASVPAHRAPILGLSHSRGLVTYVQWQSLDTIRLAQNTPAPTAGRAPGLYVQVLDGMIHLTNGGGTQNFTAGQFGFTPSFQQPPIILPTNPGIQFTPPPAFSSTTGSQAGTGGSKPGDVDCQVR